MAFGPARHLAHDLSPQRARVELALAGEHQIAALKLLVEVDQVQHQIDAAHQPRAAERRQAERETTGSARTRGLGYRKAQILPAFSWERRGRNRDLWVFPWMHFERGPEHRGSSFFPLWSYASSKGKAGRDRDLRVLGWLYETHQKNIGGEKGRAGEHVRTRVLWKLVDYRRRGEDSSLDCFPFISVDKRADGYRRFSFMWRLFRNERTADGGRKVDLLFIPIVRRKGKPQAPAKQESPAIAGGGRVTQPRVSG